MVDKIDRPNPPEPWTIKAAAQSKDRGAQHGQQPSQERDDEYSSPGSPNQRWQKFHGTGDTRRIISIERSDIKHLWFRKSIIQRQSALVECDVEMHSGAFYRGAQFLLPRLDDYFQFKGYVLGQEIPATSITHDLVTEVSIPLSTTSTAPHAAPPLRAVPQPMSDTTPWWSLWDAHTHQLRPTAILIYSLAALTFVSVILLLV